MLEQERRPAWHFRTGRWRVEPEVGRLRSGNELVSLEPEAMVLLVFLAERAGQLLSAEELIEAIWPGQAMDDCLLFKRVAQIRRALGDDPREPVFVETVPGQGYRFIAEVLPACESVGAEALPGSVLEAEPEVQSPWPDARFLLASMLVGLCVLVVAISGMTDGRGNVGQAPPGPLVVLPFASVNGGSPTAIDEVAIRRELMELLRAAPELDVVDYLLWSERSAVLGKRSAWHLSGDVEVRNERVALDLKLADAAGQSVWHEQVDLHMSALPTRLETLASELAGMMGMEPPDFATAGCTGTEHFRSCQLYLMASDYLRLPRPIGEARERAVDLLSEAVLLDPDFAPAHARLAMLWLIMDVEGESRQFRSQAVAALERAQALSADHPETMAARGILRMLDSRHYCNPDCLDPQAANRVAEVELRAALRMDPGSVWARHWLVLSLQGQGRFHEAFSQVLLAYARDPMHPLANLRLVSAYAGQGDIESARRIAEEYLAGHPQGARSMYRVLAWAESRHGFHQQSLDWQIRSSELGMDRASHTDLILMARTLLALGLDEVLTDVLERIEGGTCELGVQPWHRSHVKARLALLLTGKELDRHALESMAGELLQVAGHQYGDQARWPRWIPRMLGQIHLHQGRYEDVISWLDPLYSGPRPPVDQLALLAEVDAMQALAYALQQTGRINRGEALVRYSIELLESYGSQVLDTDPGFEVLLAQAQALLRRDSPVLTDLERASVGGFLEHRLIRHDPRWQREKHAEHALDLARFTPEWFEPPARIATIGMTNRG
jgi:DNA-binding winged helix-turn-helix (wHTH) protein/tetratricopeptide (TPR) repeat protein